MKKLLAAGLSVCLLLCGGCTTKTVETPPPTPSVIIPEDPAVKTDWSKLTPYEAEQPIYTRRYAEFTDTLIPAADYGPLVPYLGDRLGGDRYDGALYGLVTLTGVLVTDPVFTKVWRGISTFGLHGDGPLPYLMLYKGGVSSSMDDWPTDGAWAMAAPDGSWCTEFKYIIDSELPIWGWGYSNSCSEDGIFAIDGDALVYLDGATGKEHVRIKGFPLDEWHSVLYSAYWQDGDVLYSWDDYSSGVGMPNYFRFDTASGVSVKLTRSEWDALEQARHPATTEEPKTIDGKELNSFLVGGDGWRWYRDGGELVFLREGEARRLKTDADPVEVKWGQVLFLQDANGGTTYMTMDGKVLAYYPVRNPNAWDVKGYDAVTGERYLRLPAERGYDYYNESGTYLASCPTEATLAGGLFHVGNGLRALSGEWVFRYPLAEGEWD